ncbi:MAG TPA: ATP-binding protein [Acidimicrobiales bacterium]|jgi:two-component system sensor histidine kinase SenX3
MSLALVLGVLLLVAGAVAARAIVALRASQDQVGDLDAAVERAARQRTEAARERSRLTLSLAAIEHGVLIFDEQGDVVYRNDPAAAFLAARHGDVLVEEAITSLARAALRGRSNEHELAVYGPPRRTLSLRAVPLDDADSPAGALVVVEDTSARRRLENVRRDFVANISHELKTPVGALSLLAETLVGEDDPEVMRPLAERISNEAFRVGHIIDDLLELSRLEGASPSETEEPLSVAGFVDEAVDRVRPAADRRGIQLEEQEVPTQLRVQGDRRQLVSAMANLLDNAVKYSDADSVVEVQARLVREGEAPDDGDGWVEVEVRDHGIGIPQRDLERIFERFYRVDRARSRETGGTGLGLAIVRHVASNHRGEVRVESREGEGSRFVLRLPATGAHAEAVSSKEPE